MYMVNYKEYQEPTRQDLPSNNKEKHKVRPTKDNWIESRVTDGQDDYWDCIGKR